MSITAANDTVLYKGPNGESREAVGTVNVSTGADPNNFWSYAGVTGGIVSSTANVALKTAAGAGVRNYVRTITIGHDALGAVTECVILDGATVLWRGKLQTAASDISSGSGSVVFDPPLKGTANTAVNFALLTSVTGGVFVNAQGYTGA